MKTTTHIPTEPDPPFLLVRSKHEKGRKRPHSWHLKMRRKSKRSKQARKAQRGR